MAAGFIPAAVSFTDWAQRGQIFARANQAAPADEQDNRLARF